MTLISFVDRIRRGPEFLFIMVPQRREGVTQLILIMVCMGFSNNLRLSHLSALWRTLLEPNRKHLLLSGKPPEKKVSQEVRTVGRAGAHARQGQVWLMAASLRGSFCFPAFSRIDLQLSRLSPSLQSWGRQIFRAWRESWLVQGLEVGGGGMPGLPTKLAQAHRGATWLPTLSLCNTFKNEFSNPASWWNYMYR